MDRDQFFVVLHNGERKVKHNGAPHPYESQADVVRSAIEAAHSAHRKGGLSQVLVQGQACCGLSGPTAKIRTHRQVDDRA